MNKRATGHFVAWYHSTKEDMYDQADDGPEVEVIRRELVIAREENDVSA